ncbi:MAG: tetratricopeptide repeat protein, partial [Mesorhizobium sp.]
ALQLHQAGRRQEAEAIYRQVLARQPKHAAAAHFLGLLLHQTGRNEEGMDFLEQSVQLQPTNPDFLNNLGTV